MLDTILNAVVSALIAAGISAVRQFPATPPNKSAPIVCVGLKSNKLISAGAGDYMGQKTESGVVSEVYGFRMEPVLDLDIYAPDNGTNGASGCLAGAEKISAALSGFPSGIKPRELICGETGFDSETEMFRMPAELKCSAFLTREKESATGEFTDFVLKGVLG